MWNLGEKKEEEEKENNEPYIGIAIIQCQQGGYYLLVRQCVNIVNIANKNKISVWCGTLSYKFNTDKLHTQHSQVPFNGGEFYIEKDVTKQFEEGIFP